MRWLALEHGLVVNVLDTFVNLNKHPTFLISTKYGASLLSFCAMQGSGGEALVELRILHLHLLE